MNTDKLKSELITIAESMTRGRHLQSIQGLGESQKSINTRKLSIMARGRHLQNIQGLSESQKSISTRKLSIAVEEIEDRQKVDAAFLKRVFDYIVELERANETK